MKLFILYLQNHAKQSSTDSTSDTIFLAVVIVVYFCGWTQKNQCQNMERNTSTSSLDTSARIQSSMKRHYSSILVDSWVYWEETWDSCLGCLVLQAFSYSITILVHLLLHGNGSKCRFELICIGILPRQNSWVWTYCNNKQLLFLPRVMKIFNYTRINRRWQFVLSQNYVVVVILWLSIRWIISKIPQTTILYK